MSEDREFLRCGRAGSGHLGGPNIKAVLLGKTARYAPDRAFDTVHVAIDLKIDFRSRSAAGTCRTVIRAFQDKLRQIELDAVDLRIAATTVDGHRVRHKHKAGKLTLQLGKAL